MKSQRIPLVGSLVNRLESGAVVVGKNQQFINCFPEITQNAVTGAGSISLLKRYGYTVSQTLADVNYSVSNIGATVWKGLSNTSVFSVSRLTAGGITRIYYESGSQVGADITPAIACTSITETVISNVPTLVAITLSLVGLPECHFFPYGGAWTKITDTDFPPNQGTPLTIMGEPVHKDGYMFVIDSYGRIWNSDLNSLANWTATSYIDASESADGGSGLALYNNMIVAFGVSSIQFFQNSGNATGSPLSRVPKTINIGISQVSTTSGYRYILPVGDTVYFIGYNKKEFARHVYRLNGLSAEKVSTPAVDKFLNDANFMEGTTAHMAGVAIQNGMTHVVINGDSTNGAYCYCIETGVWWRLNPFNGFTNLPAFSGTKCLIGRIIYSLGTTFVDNATTITMTVRTDPFDQGTSRKKFYHEAELIADSRSTSGNTSISWFDDDYTTESTARTIDLSTGSRRITRLGSTQRNYNNKRAWKITETVNAPFRGEALELRYEEGAT